MAVKRQSILLVPGISAFLWLAPLRKETEPMLKRSAPDVSPIFAVDIMPNLNNKIYF